MSGVFSGRSLTVVNDFTLDEQIFLYEKTRELKDALLNGRDVSDFRINDPDFTIYLMFFENSTRTKESFQNAARFHGSRVNVFDAETSSFSKKESITDTVKMLFGYSRKSAFIIRSGLEGVCSWLDYALGKYAALTGFPRASFINGGDGKHEHPTQEFLDEFSFLEQRDWNRDKIHLALVGDLCHGRTVHSKADGLKVFKEVHVDLISPSELALPDHYEKRMLNNGFKVKKYSSIEEYLAGNEVAPIWYFTRLQLERMGDEIRDKASALRKTVTFTEDYLELLPSDTKFYHPLPRHRENPVVPAFLDELALNGWDAQSTNGYYTRIMEIALLYGLFDKEFIGKAAKKKIYIDDFVEEVLIKQSKKPEHKIGIIPVQNGIVIDHIGKGEKIYKIWNHIDKIRQILKFNYRSSHGVFHTDAGTYKGIISLPDILSLNEREIKMLGAVVPGCTLNMIKDGVIKKKYRLHMPPRVYNFDEISCKNEKCISFPSHYEHVRTEFFRSGKSEFVCKFCEKPHNFHDIWDI